MRRGILATIEELRDLRRKIQVRPFDAIYDRLQKRCSLILESRPITERQCMTLWSQGVWGASLKAVRSAQGRIMDLVVAHNLDPNPAYRSRAVEELRNVASWTSWVDPAHNHSLVDLCTAEAATTVAIGLDWLWDEMSEADRQRAIEAIKSKAIEPYLQSVKDGAWWYDCYHSWNAVINSGMGVAGVVLGDEDSSADKAHKLAMKGIDHFFDALGSEGGWDEGTGYWGYAIRYALILGEACEHLTDDQRIFHKRGLNATGAFPIYFTPNGKAASFGDNPGVPAHGMTYSLASHFGLRELAWWLDTYTFEHDLTTTGWSQAGLAMLKRPIDAEAPSKFDLEPVKVFNEIGWGAMADSWPQPSFYVAAKTGDMSANHSQRDMNSLQLQVDGEMMLTDPGNPPYCAEYFSDSRAEFYEVQARGHNTIVVAERDHQIDARGQIVEAQSGPMHRWIACDAKGACGDSTMFMRHIVMLLDEAGNGQSLVVVDDVTNGAPETLVLHWHSLGDIVVEPSKLAGTITGAKAKLHFAIVSTVRAHLMQGSHKLGSGATDRVIQISAGLIGRGYMVSVFSRDKVGEIEIIEGDSPSEALQLEAAGARLAFKQVRHGLQLTDVTRL